MDQSLQKNTCTRVIMIAEKLKTSEYNISIQIIQKPKKKKNDKCMLLKFKFKKLQLTYTQDRILLRLSLYSYLQNLIYN